ncbi:MAG: flavin reductase family protein [Mesonia hippocampi]|uniref:flavin reductase family protein n=1 Tax=Mesonia hippocampi TaxID=1628250 RepID=UPI003F971F04
MFTITPSEISTQKLYGFLVSTIGPRPIAFASTISKTGEVNLAPFSFFNMVSANPPTLMFSPLSRISDNTEKDTLKNIKETQEVVINMVNYAMVHQMSLSSCNFAPTVNEFEKAGFSMEASEEVKPYRVKEAPVQLECKVSNVVNLGSHGGAGNIVICEVVKIHIAEAFLTADEKIDQHKLDLVARMGGNWYTRAKEGMFELPKPISAIGMGIDALPVAIKNSTVFTGNNLGQLASLEKMPSLQDATDFIENSEFKDLIASNSVESVHHKVKELLNANHVEKAWNILVAYHKK